MQTTVAGTTSRVKNSQNKGQNEKNPGQPTGEFCQHIGRLRAKNVLSDPPTKGRAKTLTFRPLHQNDQGHQHRNRHVDSEENADENIHWERTISADRAACKRSTGYVVIPSPHDSERVNLTALSRQVSGKAIPIKNKMTSRIRIKLQSFVIDRDGAESVRRFFR